MKRGRKDSFRTETNVELNEYIQRLNKKISELTEEKSTATIYTLDDGSEYLITTHQANVVENPNGRYKWDGWVVTGKRYSMYLYDDFDREKKRGRSAALMSFVDDNKDDANRHYLMMRNSLKKG